MTSILQDLEAMDSKAPASGGNGQSSSIVDQLHSMDNDTFKEPKKPTLEQRARDVFSVTLDDEIEELLYNRAEQIRYETGQKADVLYSGRRMERFEKALPGNKRRYGKEMADVLDTDPKLGKPVGIRLGDGSIIKITDDKDLKQKVAHISARRMKLIKEIAETNGALSFGERTGPSWKTTGPGFISKLKDDYGDDNVKPIGKDKDNALVFGKDGKVRIADKRGEAFSWTEEIEWADIADITGDAAETLASLGITYFAARQAAKKGGAPLSGAALAKAEAIGDFGGNIVRQVGSHVVGGNDYPGQTILESLPQRGLQAAITMGTGQLSSLVGKGLGKLAKENPILARAREARLAKKELKQESTSKLEPETVGSFLDESAEIEAKFGEISGRNVGLSPGQATGSKRLLRRERGLASGENADDVLLAHKRNVAEAAATLDDITNAVAKNPDMLGREAVATRLGKVANDRVDSMIKLRSVETTPLYMDAEKQLGNVISARPIREKILELADMFERVPEIVGKLRADAEFIEAAADRSGKIGIRDINKELKYWSQIAGGKVYPFEKMDKAAQRKAAREMLFAIDTAMDAVADVPGVQSLRAARSLWAAHSKAIDGFNNKFMKSILRLGKDEADEKIINKIMGAPVKQVRGLFRSLDSFAEGKDIAKDLRAQILLEVSSKGGKLAKAKPFGVEPVSMNISPAAMAKALEEKSELIDAIFSNDRLTRNNLKVAFQIFDRLSQGPNFMGSQTAGLLANSPGMLKEISKNIRPNTVTDILNRAPMAAAERVAQIAGDILGLRVTDKQLLDAIVTRKGSSAWRQIAQTQYSPFRAKATQATTRAVVQLAAIIARNEMLSGDSKQ